MAAGDPASIDLQYFERLCKTLYEGTNQQERMEAEQALNTFSDSKECHRQCFLLLSNSAASVYVSLVAAKTLLRVVSKRSCPMSAAERLELQRYLLQVITQNTMPSYVLTSLAQLFARVTKLGWFDFQPDDEEFMFRAAVNELMRYSESSQTGRARAIDILRHVVLEVNQLTGLHSISLHRRIVAAFRDHMLFDIFKLAFELLAEVMNNIKLLDASDESQVTLISNALQLTLACLSFDFIGCATDESTDDTLSLQLPTTWRNVVLTVPILQLYFNLYHSLPSQLAPPCLSNLVQLASIRRTLFSNTERQEFLSQLVKGAKSILEAPEKLSDQNVYHELCRLICRVKSNYQLNELIRLDDYGAFLRLVTDFTTSSLHVSNYAFAANSVHYLLSFWQRLVSSMPYVRAAEPHQLDHFAPLVTKAYIDSRLALAAAVGEGQIDDPLDDYVSLGQQLEQMSVITRCDYKSTCELVGTLFDASATRFQGFVANNQHTGGPLADQGSLIWLVFIIGAAVGGRASLSNAEDQDEQDGEMICRVLQLMQFTDKLLPSFGTVKLELAYSWFLEQFRKVHISENIQPRTSKVFHKLSQTLDIKTEQELLAHFVRKIITNLKFWPNHDRLVGDTLSLLNDLSIGYSSVRKLARLDEVQYLLTNHTAENFSMLGSAVDISIMRARTTLYTALMRLLTVDYQFENEEEFDHFVAPLSTTFVRLQMEKLFSGGTGGGPGEGEAKKVIIGLARDIRGIAFASNTKSSYHLLFDWLFPDKLGVFERSIELWYHDPDLASPVLKMLCELCQNRSQRLNFDCTSANSYLLFRVASKVISTFARLILSLDVSAIPEGKNYRVRLKGMSTCFSILKHILNGNYVNFGVFRLYGDNCLDEAFTAIVSMIVSIPHADLLAYNKLTHSCFMLLDSLTGEHMAFLSHLEPSIFVHIVMALYEGLSCLDSLIATSVCSTMDHVFSYLYSRVSKQGKTLRKTHPGRQVEGDNCIRSMQLFPEVYQQGLATMLTTVMSDECRNQWSLSRPLLSLALLFEDYFAQLRSKIIMNLPAEKQQPMADAFTGLMNNVERSLSSKNKDTFTQNIAEFRKTTSDIYKGFSSSGPPPLLVTDCMSIYREDYKNKLHGFTGMIPYGSTRSLGTETEEVIEAIERMKRMHGVE